MADNNKVENTKALLREKKPRNRILITIGVILVIVVGGAILFASGSKKSKEAPATTTVGSTPSVTSIPGTSSDPAYQKLQAEKNQRDFEEASKSGKSVVPVLIGTDGGAADPMAGTKPAQPTSPPVVAPLNPIPVTPVQPLNPIPRSTDLNGNGSNGSKQQQYANAQKQMNTYLEAFKLKGSAQEFSYYGTKPDRKADEETATDGTASSGAAGDAAVAKAASDSAKAATFVRAGTIIPAVLITPVNSDTPGPILAQITSGPLAGARLLGTFRASRNQVVLTFNQLSMLNQPSSFKVQAYAVDANTSSPGLATDVNNHYLAKYGLLAAAEFISGYGQAVANQNTTTVVGPLGGATVVNDGLDNSQITKAALGQVGSRLSSQIQSESSQLRPTIKVQGPHGQGGVPIGLLFMSDF